MSTTLDFWPGEGLPPGSVEEMLQGSVACDPPDPVTRAVGKVVYAEFDDGRRLSPEAEKVCRWLTQRRVETQKAYQELLEAYKLGGVQALEEVFRSDQPSRSRATEIVSRARRKAYTEKGLDYLLPKLRRVASLKIPQ